MPAQPPQCPQGPWPFWSRLSNCSLACAHTHTHLPHVCMRAHPCSLAWDQCLLPEPVAVVTVVGSAISAVAPGPPEGLCPPRKHGTFAFPETRVPGLMLVEPTLLSCQMCSLSCRPAGSGDERMSCAERDVVRGGSARSVHHSLMLFHFCSLSKPFKTLCVACRVLHSGLNGEISRGAVFLYTQSEEVVCIRAACICFLHLRAVLSRSIIPAKQQVIFHVDTAFGHHRGYFPSLSLYNSLLSC